MSARLAFALPPAQEAPSPPEARGIPRDGVRMLVAHRAGGALQHTTFDHLPEELRAGDVVVVNTSGTLPAALDGLAGDGTRVVVHLSTHLEGELWVVEPRRPGGGTSSRWARADDDGEDGAPPRRIAFDEGAGVELLEPYQGSPRLWVARLSVPGPVPAWLADHGRPIRYGYVDRAWPIEAYQNVYATEPGSAEMPSAGRPFTTEVITRLAANGITVAPLLLHTGVASLESGETPFPERLVVPLPTARQVNLARATGGRVIAVGTTVVRAIESAATDEGEVRPLDGWTDLVITPERGLRAVDGLLTGWHEPEASHLLMLEAIAGRRLLERSYEASLAEGYLWHEFGDVHLILP